MNKEKIALNVLSYINFIFNKIGYNLKIEKFYYEDVKKKQCCINVGSGNWEAKGWTNLDYPSEWYKKDQKRHHIIPFDIRKDELPYEDESIDLIYCSHVIEHIEDTHIKHFFSEAYRVLKKNGGMRITCPDAEFLYKATKADKDFWEWRKKWFQQSQNFHGAEPRPVDFLVSEIATPQLIGNPNGTNDIDYEKAFVNSKMEDFFQNLTKDLVYREAFPGDHINYWTESKLTCMLKNAKFEKVFKSKANGSVFKEMRLPGKFDTTFPNFSLYVECLK